MYGSIPAPEKPEKYHSVCKAFLQETSTFQDWIDLKGQTREFQFHTSHFKRFRNKKKTRNLSVFIGM